MDTKIRYFDKRISNTRFAWYHDGVCWRYCGVDFDGDPSEHPYRFEPTDVLVGFDFYNCLTEHEKMLWDYNRQHSLLNSNQDTIFSNTVVDFGEFITRSFIFSETPEGFDYWDSISQENRIPGNKFSLIIKKPIQFSFT